MNPQVHRRATMAWLICKQDGCVKQARVTGFCQPHYQKAYNATRVTSDGTGKRLTEADVVEARRMRARFKTNYEIAARFGVDAKTITRVFAGKYKAEPTPDEGTAA